MKKATVGLLAVFGLALILFWIQYDLATSEVSLTNLSAKTTHSTVYVPLEPEIVSSLGLQAVKATETDSFFTPQAFQYSLFFLVLIAITGAFRLYYKAGVKKEAAWLDFQKSLSKSEKSLHNKE